MVDVTACIPTRGDVDLERIIESIPPSWDVVIYDNSQEERDLSVFGRYAAIDRAKTDIVYTQDDDCVLTPDSFRELERHYQFGAVTANMPLPFRAHYSDSCLVGFGAIFDKHLPVQAFGKLWGNVGIERALRRKSARQFMRTCDVYFTTLTPMKWLNLEYENLPWATDETRMYRQSSHVGERAQALDHARSLR